MLGERLWQLLANQSQVAQIHGQSEFGEKKVPRSGRIGECPNPLARARSALGYRARIPYLRERLSIQVRPEQDVSGFVTRKRLLVSCSRLEERLELSLVLRGDK